MSISAPYLKRSASGVYYVHWTEHGIGKRVSTRQKDLDGPRGAKTFLAGWIMMETARPAEKAATMTFRDIWTVYADRHIKTEIVNWKKAEYTGRLLLEGFGHLPIPQIGQRDVDLYVKRRLSGAIGGNQVKPQTVRHELTYLIAALNFCTINPHKMLDANVVRDIVKGLKLPAAGARRERWLTLDEIQRLLDAAATGRGEDDRLTRGERFLWLALETAARKQAILDLTWDRVDFETGVIRYDVPGRAVTKKRRATVPISRALRPVLERAYAERQGNLVMDNRAMVWSIVQTIAANAKLAPAGYEKPKTGQKPKATGISPHVLRHTAATLMARRRVPFYIIAAILGNSVEMVTQVYGHHSKDDLQEAVDMISGGMLEAAE